MNPRINRRTTLKLLSSSAIAGLLPSRSFGETSAPSTEDPWAKTHNRTWLGGHVWANPMEDWRILDGAAECLSDGPSRSVHSLTHQITANRPFELSVTLQKSAVGKRDTGAGFRIGLLSEINDHRANCFVTQGLHAGWLDGSIVIGEKSTTLISDKPTSALRLTLTGTPDGAQCQLTLTAHDTAGTELGKVTLHVTASSILGNVSLAHNILDGTSRTGRPAKGASHRYRFRDWQLSGEGFTVTQSNRFGPILWAMYSLSDSRGSEGFVMKLSALTGPLGEKDSKDIELLIEKDSTWKSLGTATLDPDAWVATFRIAHWDEKHSTAYKVVYHEKHTDATSTPHEWTGTILANPVGRPLRMAALTCQNDYAFPYAPVADNVAKLKPDLIFFSGDQIYENHGGFGLIRNPAETAILNYLRKFYQFGWSFREAMRHAPTLCLPDDHDVFQGNIWGEGGMKMPPDDPGGSSTGGYIEPARMVNAVHRTNTAHHPDPYDPKPCLQDISVYYGDMVYGGVGFAILADRQWKTGPQHVETGKGRPDHIEDKDFDAATLDKPGLILLGERQEAFLEKWSNDWRGHALKAVLSQTVFAGVATHHGGRDGYLKGDLDSGAWPQTPRNRAIDLMRPSMALHINGDQHLTTLVQYGVQKQRDSNWSFCTPAIGAGYPRWWLPDELGIPHENRPNHGLPDTGEFIDGFGNKAYVFAVGNPVVGKAPNRYHKAHEKGSGFGFITFDTVAKTYHIESFRFNIDPTAAKPENQFPGWPVTLHQQENRGENRLG